MKKNLFFVLSLIVLNTVQASDQDFSLKIIVDEVYAADQDSLVSDQLRSQQSPQNISFEMKNLLVSRLRASESIPSSIIIQGSPVAREFTSSPLVPVARKLTSSPLVPVSRELRASPLIVMSNISPVSVDRMVTPALEVDVDGLPFENSDLRQKIMVQAYRTNLLRK